jgi:formate dehydrogenase major subunit
MPEGMVFVPFCYVEAAANMLTNPALDPYGKIPEFKVAAARVERAATKPPVPVAAGDGAAPGAPAD